jgi:hypothetical protein
MPYEYWSGFQEIQIYHYMIVKQNWSHIMVLHSVFVVEVTINLQTRIQRLNTHPGTSVIQYNSYQVTTDTIYINSSTPNVTKHFVLPHSDGILSRTCAATNTKNLGGSCLKMWFQYVNHHDRSIEQGPDNANIFTLEDGVAPPLVRTYECNRLSVRFDVAHDSANVRRFLYLENRTYFYKTFVVGDDLIIKILRWRH